MLPSAPPHPHPSVLAVWPAPYERRHHRQRRRPVRRSMPCCASIGCATCCVHVPRSCRHHTRRLRRAPLVRHCARDALVRLQCGLPEGISGTELQNLGAIPCLRKLLHRQSLRCHRDEVWHAFLRTRWPGCFPRVWRRVHAQLTRCAATAHRAASFADAVQLVARHHHSFVTLIHCHELALHGLSAASCPQPGERGRLLLRSRDCLLSLAAGLQDLGAHRSSEAR